LFISHPGNRDERREYLHLLTTVFHEKYESVAPEPESVVTLGLATEPSPAEGRSTDYLLCQGVVWDPNAQFVEDRAELYEKYFPASPL
jgi:hypothetical protein